MTEEAHDYFEKVLAEVNQVFDESNFPHIDATLKILFKKGYYFGRSEAKAVLSEILKPENSEK